ncbi:hypothetical protein PG991_009116 [Apiospora marii]|uniref:Uncharacterized protein n=1 Tax=Apiospora marii TaxID=335849 RepID=A0ABR1RK92_9PEZI
MGSFAARLRLFSRPQARCANHGGQRHGFVTAKVAAHRPVPPLSDSAQQTRLEVAPPSRCNTDASSAIAWTSACPRGLWGPSGGEIKGARFHHRQRGSKDDPCPGIL